MNESFLFVLDMGHVDTPLFVILGVFQRFERGGYLCTEGKECLGAFRGFPSAPIFDPVQRWDFPTVSFGFCTQHTSRARSCKT